MDALVTLLLYALVLALVWFVISRLPLPSAVRLVFEVGLAILALLVLLGLLTGSLPFPHLRRF